MVLLYFKKFLLLLTIIFFFTKVNAQNSPNTQKSIKPVELHMYGRLGVHSSLSGKNLGARLNLSGMAAIGGRLEESDYMEISPVFNVSHFANIDGPLVRFFLTVQVFSGDGTYIMYNTALNFSEAYLQVIDTTSSGKPWELWLGSRFYRSRTIDLIDYWDFDNLSGHGLGVKFHNTAFAFISTVPFSEKSGNPYGYSGFNELEQKYVASLKHKVPISKTQDLFFIGEAHFATIDSVDNQNFTNSPFQFDDWGLVAGVQHHIKKGAHENYATIRYGNRIANGPGDDGWSSRTFITYGNPDKDNLQYQGAEGLNITEHYIFEGSQLFNLQAYATYRYAKGADDPLVDYSEFPNANEKWDFGIGIRPTFFISDKFHLITEAHYTMREYKEGHNGIVGVDPGLGEMTKFTVGPTYVPSGKRNQNTRPHFRLIYAIAFYNDVVQEYGLSQYYEASNRGEVGQYLGLKTEWWF